MVRLTKDGLLRINFRGYPDANKRLKCNFSCSYCMQLGQKVPVVPFAKEHYEATKSIMEMLSFVDDELMIRVNFDGEGPYYWED